MASDKSYIEILNKAKRKRKASFQYQYVIVGAALVVILTTAILAVRLFGGDQEEENQAGARAVGAADATVADIVIEETVLTPEEQAAIQQADAAKAVVDSYGNLGLVQVAGGYLNVRETPSSDGKIIGKMQENSACEILGTEGEWHHISFGGIEEYIASQYVLTGQEAQQEALQHVTKMAIVNVDDLNIRQEPEIDPVNVVGQALQNERYTVEEELAGWVKIPGGYISSDYVRVEYALNEARKLDLKAMALSQYDNLVISKVSNYMNIRKEPKQDGNANVIGKFPGNAAGEILETLDGWYKFRSGSITGYISADSQYVAVGQEARDLAMQSAELMAIVQTDKLNVRSEPNTDSKIWTQISKEERYPVAEQLDGWVQIELDAGDSEDGSSDKAYISTRDNNVEVRYALAEAIKFSPLEEQANRQSALRSKVVNYGLQFVGGRYVWGGTNPNTGADCSGFVQYVLRNAAGVSLPRTSREQAKVGRAITSSEMRPGDLIFYTNSSGVVNHVAMYIGNGQVVHAASRRSGIRISTWNYRSPKSIRSVLD